MYRQGDVLLVPVDSIPASVSKIVPRDGAGRIVLARGEAHGHAHAIKDGAVTAFRVETAEGDVANRALADFILVGGSGATLKHELVTGVKADHDEIALPPGAYRVVQQREFRDARASARDWD